MIEIQRNKKSVYFVASLVGKEVYGEAFIQIAKILRNMGFIVWDDVNTVSADQARKYSKQEIKEYYIGVQERIKSADFFVAELSHPSSAVGYEIGYAVANDKPALILRDESLPTDPGAPLRGNPSRLVTISKYNKFNLKHKIISFIEKSQKGIFVKRLPIEFTKDQVDYVEKLKDKYDQRSFNSTVRYIIDSAIDQNHL